MRLAAYPPGKGDITNMIRSYIVRCQKAGVTIKMNQEVTLDPVSYTHLDVYKRQEYARVIHRAIPLVKTINIYISVRMMKILTNFMVCDDHGRKDVYKRQQIS